MWTSRLVSCQLRPISEVRLDAHTDMDAVSVMRATSTRKTKQNREKFNRQIIMDTSLELSRVGLAVGESRENALWHTVLIVTKTYLFGGVALHRLFLQTGTVCFCHN